MGRPFGRPADWSSYDTVAARYDDVWGGRFQEVARLLWQRVRLPPRASVLDIGTGTGIVLGALGAGPAQVAVRVGCDRSPAMLRVARARLREACFALADGAELPFRAGVFDVATAAFVMSHLSDYEAGLGEAARVLKPGGTFGMTSWASDTDVHVRAWRELLAQAVSEDLLRAAVARVAPHEATFEKADAVRDALGAAGYVRVEVHAETLGTRMSLESFLADRALGSAGRFARDALGPAAWRSFLERAGETLQKRFGSALQVERGVLIGVGSRAA